MNIKMLVCLVFLILSICVMVKSYICMVRAFSANYDISTSDQRINNNRRGRRPSLPLDDIKKLSSFEFKIIEEENSYRVNDLMECAICLETFKLLDVCRLLPLCKHTFHLHCIDTWLAQTAACPVCRTDVRLEYPTEDGDGDGLTIV